MCLFEVGYLTFYDIIGRDDWEIIMVGKLIIHLVVVMMDMLRINLTEMIPEVYLIKLFYIEVNRIE